MDYRQEYTEYWSRPDRWGSHSFTDAEAIADQVLTLCGKGRVLDVGFGMGLLAFTLLQRGLDVKGIDVAQRVVDEANLRAPGRFQLGSILEIPYADEAFDTVLSTDCMEHIAEADVGKALSELARVTQRYLFIQLATTADRDQRWHLTIRNRAWWEQRFFEAGFRKHPCYQTVLLYESLENEGRQITLVFEKIPQAALQRFPLSALKAERDLHMDMLRETGRRSDAHVARYQLAKRLLQPNELVLDAACGLGYGSALLAQAEPSALIVGMDSSAYAIDYAQKNFTPGSPNLSFQEGDVCKLSTFADQSVGLVISFETVEHLPQPELFLAEVRRVLKSGGHFICSVPNLWVDETGRDPNPHHFHVFDFAKLAGLCGQFLSMQSVYRQNAGGSMKCNGSPRLLRAVNLPVTSGHDEAEWWLAICAKEDAVPQVKIEQSNSEYVIALTPDAAHPLYQSWQAACNLPVKFCHPMSVDFEWPDEAAIVVTTDTYSEPSVTLIRKAVEKGIPTLILADGILEYRNTWEHPQLVPGSLFQPVLGHKIACLGKSQARILESWGNGGKCEVVGLPHLDRYAALKRRGLQTGEPFRVLVMTAKTPFFTDRHERLVKESLLDLKKFFASQPKVGERVLEPVWRLTKGLENEVEVSSVCGDLTGRELAEVLQQVDAVVTTPSTSMLEAMLLGLPVAVLDYCNAPHYVPPAWRITAQRHIEEVMSELVNPPEAKMLFQETTLHDALECASPATPRLTRLITEMIEAGRRAKQSGQPLRFEHRILEGGHAQPQSQENRFRPELLYPGQDHFSQTNLTALQAEVGHLRKYAAGLEQRGQSSPFSGGVHSAQGDAKQFSFLPNLSLAKLVRGKPEQKAIWDVVLNEDSSQAIFLQPPAELLFTLPVATPGKLSTAIAIHPEAWSKPHAGGCEFYIRVDGRLALVVAIDPINAPGDRRWHPIELDVAHTPSGNHQITFETRSIGNSVDFRWALWREPRFTWRPDQNANS